MRGQKSEVFEGGIRSPFYVRWPGHIAPGSVIDEPVGSIDLLPTFAAVAGVA